jgi:hypothetical protein
MTTFKDQLNLANTNELNRLLADMKFGDFVRSMPVTLSKQAPVAGSTSNGNLTTIDVIHLPNDCKAACVLRACVRAGSTTGELTSIAHDTTPSTTDVAVTPNGDIAFNHGTDAVTDVDVVFVPQVGDIVQLTLPVVTGVMTLPAAMVAQGVLLLLDATVLAGTTLGPKIILAPVASTGLPATTKAQLTSNKSTVSFNNSTDAVTMATVTLLLAPAVSTFAKLGADAV